MVQDSRIPVTGPIMADSNSFSSLLAMVDDHLSKTSIKNSESNRRNSGINIIAGSNSFSQSENCLSHSPGQRFHIPSLSDNDHASPITNILAEQVANMLKAKEKQAQREEEEKQQLAAELEKMRLEENSEKDLLINLMQSIQDPSEHLPMKTEEYSSCSSLESLFQAKFIDCDAEPQKISSPEPELPCIQDMSYILLEKIKHGKCSAFGKVLTSRLHHVDVPYIMEKYESNIIEFDFATPSPCDIMKEKLKWRPYVPPQMANKPESVIHSEGVSHSASL